MNLACQVRRIERPLDDVAIVSLDLPTGVTFRFRAGQYVEVLLEGGARRSFSIANPPQDAATIELHIRRVPGGRFTERVFSELRAGDALEILGPKGGFYLRKEARPVILLASGTGFAPIKSMVLFAMRHQLRGPAHLYWGARSARELYMAELPAAWARDYPGFHFVPVVSEPQRVHEAVMADFPDLSGHDVYACGVPALVNAARSGFIERCGLPPERFFADTFLTTADRLGTTP
jgi:CDP-4-dehydro-6-deoxyglucose reductase